MSSEVRVLTLVLPKSKVSTVGDTPLSSIQAAHLCRWVWRRRESPLVVVQPESLGDREETVPTDIILVPTESAPPFSRHKVSSPMDSYISRF